MATIYSKYPNREKYIWDALAFLGRYCGQPLNVSLKLAVGDLYKLTRATSKLITEERKSGTEIDSRGR